MSDLKFMDAWLYADEKDILDGWEQVLDGLANDPPPPGVEPDAAKLIATINSVRSDGWMGFGYDADISPVLFAEGLKRLHRRKIPLVLPLTEIWLAARLLRDFAGTNAAAAELLAGTESDGPTATLAITDLFKPGEASGPATTGWVTFADELPFLLPVRNDGGVDVYLVPASAGERSEDLELDPTLHVSRVTLASLDDLVQVGSLDAAALDAARSEVMAAQSAAMVGQAQALLSMTIEYLKIREQFGVPIGSFQALKHRCADLTAELHVANLISGYVASRMVSGADLGPLGHLAKAFCGRAATQVASEAVQLHGGIGFTWEGQVHFGLKRCAYLAMSGLTVGECELALADWAIAADDLVWSASEI